jgi:uroporphyrinogen III methyltransferase / synthase
MGMNGKVWLVGAGPGDPGLITVKGREVLERADVIVYDRVVSSEFLENVSEGAEVVRAGAQPGLHEMTQDELNLFLVHKAREGKRVVRLKGGDPFIFGRGGEEAEALRAAGVPFEVVNGVTSAIAAPAHAGIPLTHREIATTFAVVSGSEEDSPPDWARLANAVDTLVLMRATTNLGSIMAALQEHGRPASTPVAVIPWGENVRRETIVGTLAGIAEKAAAAGIEPPTVTIVGEVVLLRERLRWFDDRPLFGRRVLVTRTRQRAPELRRLLLAEGAEVVELPTAEIAETVAPEIIDRVVTALVDGQYGWAIFTSAGAVDRFFRHLGEQGRDARAFGITRIGAIGTAAVDALERHGIRSDARSEGPTASALVDALATRSVGRRRILLPRAENPPPDLIDGLRRLGAEVEELPLFVTSIPRQPNRESLGRLRRGEIDIVTFASATSVTNLTGMLGGDLSPLKQTVIACIGSVSADTARELGLKVDIVAPEPTPAGLTRAMRDRFATAGAK